MKKSLLFTMLMCIGFINLYAQKTLYWPTDFDNPNSEFYQKISNTRKYESENFVVYWGDKVGTDPANYSDAALKFNPKSVADTLETSFKRYVTDLKFCSNDPSKNLGKYKIITIMMGTWNSTDDRLQAFAQASSFDNVIGAMFCHPSATKDGGALSHEFAHTLQMMMRIQENPGNNTAFAGYDWAGPFFEGHANFMRAQAYPKWAEIDGTLTRWIQTRHFMWSSTRHMYTNFHLMYYVQEKDGFDFTRRMWAESKNSEHPLETIKRLKGFTQEQLNDYLWGYAQRQPGFDYPIRWDSKVYATNNFGSKIRETYQFIKNSMPRYTSRQFALLTKVAGSTDQYYTNNDWAPQDYGMNVIPLYPTCAGTSKKVTIKFKGHTEVNTTQAGWRYGFVTTKSDGTVSRYSPMYSTDGEASFTLETATETGIYLVVFSAPKVHVNYNMDEGYPKQRRYPYELKIANANPEGYQPAADFRSWMKTNGKIHSNGGGWISNNASVASTVYVGPYAIVKSGTLTGNARIEDFATVEGGNISGNAIVRGNAYVYNATLSGDAIAEGNAWMEGGSLTNSAKMQGNALCWGANYSGTVVIGGDAENGSCASGVYQQFPYWRNGRADCDGKGASDASNTDINATFTNFTANQMAFATTPSCTTVAVKTYTLTASTVGSGTVTTTSGTYDEGTTATLTAKPSAGYLFTGWSGDATGTTNPLSVTMSANKTIVATFTAIPEQTLTYNVTMTPMTDYTPTVVTLNGASMATFFGLTTAQISSGFGSTIKYYAINPDASLDSVSTAVAPGHWFAKTGATMTYSANAYMYSELDMTKLLANIGQYPNNAKVGDVVTLKQALIYTKSATEVKRINLVFNVSVKSTVTSVNELSQNHVVTIAPNPSSNTFTLVNPAITDVEIYALDGKLISSYKEVSTLEFGTDLKAGIYLLKVDNAFYKIVKQ